MSAPVVTFLSDFGYDDEYVGVCHGVIASRCPTAHVIDISHGVAPQDIRAGALMLRAALPYMPTGVHLAVVDPGVGLRQGSHAGAHARREVALATAAREQLLVGPDNGLLWPAAAQLGGVARAVDISHSRERLEPVSATFRGRDVFAPVAGALAHGLALGEVGEPIDAASLTTLELSRANRREGAVSTRVVAVDRFGNLTLDVPSEALAAAGLADASELRVLVADARAEGARARASARRGRTFGDVRAGGLVLHEDSRRLLALAVNRGSAAALLGAQAGDEIVLRRP
jgi:S-adenosyl-L-methionine hydrolase (adenosine-forming)